MFDAHETKEKIYCVDCKHCLIYEGYYSEFTGWNPAIYECLTELIATPIKKVLANCIERNAKNDCPFFKKKEPITPKSDRIEEKKYSLFQLLKIWWSK
jgi:hypothetical protein